MCIKDIFESWERFGVTRAVQSISFCFRWGINASYKKAASRTRDNAGGLAKAIGKSYVTIQSWEKEASYPNAESIVDMCHLFGCTPNDLFGWHEERPGGFNSLSPDERMLLDSYNACDACVRASILTVVKTSGSALSF